MDKLDDRFAPEGKIWVCCACGKTSKDQYGIEPRSSGWDESCMLNSQLFDEGKIVYYEDSNIVKEIKD
jgi:hypothetical protein